MWEHNRKKNSMGKVGMACLLNSPEPKFVWAKSSQQTIVSWIPDTSTGLPLYHPLHSFALFTGQVSIPSLQFRVRMSPPGIWEAAHGLSLEFAPSKQMYLFIRRPSPWAYKQISPVLRALSRSPAWIPVHSKYWNYTLFTSSLQSATTDV